MTTGTPTAEEILAMRPVQFRLLFPGDAACVEARFRDLAKAWHPDRNPGVDAGVFARIVELHVMARRGGAPATGERVIRARDGRVFRFAFLSRHETDFGETLVGRTRVAHLVPPDLADLAARAEAFRPRFADDGMRQEMERFLPRREMTIDTADGMVFLEAKTPDQVLLRDLLREAPFDPRHAAWMATRLVNLACWLEWAGVAHGSIGPDTLLVSPEFHSVSITGPFLTARGFGRPPLALPERTLSAMPRLSVDGEPVDARLDPALIRMTLRECLGDPAGTSLRADPTFPKPFADWLLMPAGGGARADFPAWEHARDASFGPRRFVKWDVDPVAVMAA